MTKRRREFQFHAYFDDNVNKALSFEIRDQRTGEELVAQLTSKPWRGTALKINDRSVIGAQPFSVTVAEAFELETAGAILMPRAEGVSDDEIKNRLVPTIQGSSIYLLTARFIDPAGASLHRHFYNSIDDALEGAASIAARGSMPVQEPIAGTDRIRHRIVSSLVLEMQTRRTFAAAAAPSSPNVGLE